MLECGLQEYQEIDVYCKELGIDWSASAWDQESQRLLQQFDLKFNKIASAMVVDTNFLKLVASEKRHTYLSTGTRTMEEIQTAVDIFKESGCPFELMHTVSTYPMRDEDANLNVIDSLRRRYDCAVGYSGHEVGLAVSYAAAALGITSLERHITLDRAMYGSDQAASIEPNGFRQLVAGVRKIESAMGTGEKRVLPEEVSISQKLRGHIKLESNY